MSTDATPAYRGYRLQALYTLYRILNCPKESKLVYHPEGNEDLFVYDESLSNQEVVQIKAYSAPLRLSDFAPSKRLSFFNRITPQLIANPDLKVKIFSFGDFGPELLGALTNNMKLRNTIAKKISKHKFVTEENARFMLSKVKPEQREERAILEDVFNKLGQAMTGVDPERAFELLNFWLYLCAEHKKSITREDVIEKINSVGRFLSERAAQYQEWNTVIVPIEDIDIDERWQAELSNEFYQGVSTRYEHILANLDIARSEKLKQISEKLDLKRVVIIHGASGQGKTTLAYRFIKDYLPKEWRFRVQNVENKKHALSLATALTGHANAMGIPLIVYLDVSPSDNEWVELVKQLSAHPHIRVLVTVREEDWKRASVTGYEFSFSEIELVLSKDEAQGLYDSFVEKKGESPFLNYEEAWQRFGGEGPLLEFVYLITQGTTLRERLEKQIMFLVKEAENGDISSSTLQLLLLVAVASAYESRIEVRPLIKHLGISIPGAVFRRLEQEYLIRISNQSTLVQGLHPIRSEILVELLSTVLFESWLETVQSCFPLIFEEDVEGFLMRSFSRRQEETEKLLETLSTYSPQSWAAYAGVTRALIWLGLARYIEENESLLNDAFARVGSGFTLVIDIDVTNILEGYSESFLNYFKDHIPESGFDELRDLRARQTDKDRVFRFAKDWLITRTSLPTAPKKEEDWIGVAYCGFWLGRFQETCQITNIFTLELFDQALSVLSTETLSNFMYGVHTARPEVFIKWFDLKRNLLVEKYCEETLTFRLQDDKVTITPHFVINAESSPKNKLATGYADFNKEDHIHNETMSRLHLLRRMFPHREQYASKGYGHRWVNLSTEYNFDPTEKNIRHDRFGNEWMTNINATFRRLIEKKFRTQTWQEYADQVIAFRKSIASQCRELEDALQEYYKKREPNALLDRLDINKLDEVRTSFSHTPSFPLVAVDEWGLAGEVPANSDNNQFGYSLKQKMLANEKYIPYRKYFADYSGAFSNFFSQCHHVLAVNSAIGQGKNKDQVRRFALQNGIRTDLDHISMANLAAACKVLFSLQREFRMHFEHLVDEQTLQSLEHQEKRILTRFAPIWYFFAFQPEQTEKNASQVFASVFERTKSNFIKQLSKELRFNSDITRKLSVLVKEVSFKGENAVCIAVDHQDVPIDQDMLRPVYITICNVLSQSSDKRIQQFVLDMHWSYIVVVPLLEGKKINNAVWEINLLSHLLDTDRTPSWWNLFPIEVSEEWLATLKLHMWHHPRLDIVYDMTKEIVNVMSHLNHLYDVMSMSKIDEEREGAYRRYIESVVHLIEQSNKKVLSSILRVSKVLTERNGLLVSNQSRAVLELTNSLIDTLQYTEDIPVEQHTLEIWLESIEQAFELAGLLSMHWTLYVMQEEQKTHL
ncbi:hypothetical protein [Tumebacillus lipolyticus]|uniref:Novel STAND NTPase 5 domain-containing protein n=1 Tax=Tumebacillus lipolyticus TaxID=1280370 RepID=A0ABW5A0D8_9BACL